MPRKPKLPEPWQRKDRANRWYVTIKQKQHYLGEADATAEEVRNALANLLLEANVEVSGEEGTLLPIIGRFLEHVQRNLDKRTYKTRRLMLQSWWDHCKAKGTTDITVSQLKPFHITQWLDSKATWGWGARRAAVESISVMLNWAAKEGYIETNPLARKLSRPATRSRGREAFMDESAYKTWLQACRGEHHRWLLMAMYRTGCRPCEIASVGVVPGTAFDEQSGQLTVRGKRTKSNPTGFRKVNLDPVMLDLCKKMRSIYPEGALFRNMKKKKWTSDLIAQAFRLIRRKVIEADPERADYHKKLSAYSGRHTFATNRLMEGHSEALVARQLGHNGTYMLHKHYNHVLVEDAKPIMEKMKTNDIESRTASQEEKPK